MDSTSNQKPNGHDLLALIAKLDADEVAKFYHRATHLMQAKIQQEQTPFK